MPPTQMMLSLISHEVDGLDIPQRVTDGYINATALCQASGKQLGHYLANKNTQDFIAALSAVMGIPITDLVVSVQGGSPALQGTWVHPDMAAILQQSHFHPVLEFDRLKRPNKAVDSIPHCASLHSS